MKVKLYSLNKARKVLIAADAAYRRRWRRLSAEELKSVEEYLEKLDWAIREGNQEKADNCARWLEDFVKRNMRKNLWEHCKELVYALIFALIVATVVRQVWFEHYEVPTGSMRPTLEELDHLIVSKVDFGVNVPLMPKHFYFDPDLVKRLGMIIFTVEDLDVADPDTKYFYLFPGKKRYVKRLIGKPGDSLYFYGGKIYGVDIDGNDIKDLRENPLLDNLEHIPFMTFDGKKEYSSMSFDGMIRTVKLRQMNMPLVELKYEGQNRASGRILYDAVDDDGQKLYYGDIWGIKNFGMARLLTPREVELFSDANLEGLDSAPLYLEIRHTPSVFKPRPHIGMGIDGYFQPMLTLNTTLIPLKIEHLHNIMDNLYTSRFFVRDGKVARYRMNQPSFAMMAPEVLGVPDGCYEFYYGKAWEVKWGGMRFVLPDDHPLYDFSIGRLQTLYNLGIELSGIYAPCERHQAIFPARYAYFRDGDLYLLGAPIMKKNDPTLVAFHEREKKLERKGSYVPFVDYGPPITEDGKFDVGFVRQYGLTLPDNMYLVLGDNHAVSGDSRAFGFVPGENLRGAPSFIIWPPGKTWGMPAQVAYGWLTAPRLIVWGIFVVIAACYTWWYYRRRKNFRFYRRS